MPSYIIVNAIEKSLALIHSRHPLRLGGCFDNDLSYS